MMAASSLADHSMSDLKLLESGNFADVTVTCGARTWKLHKLILCSRSRFFDKALSAPYKVGAARTLPMSQLIDPADPLVLCQEAVDRVVNIQQQDPEAIDVVLKLIYGGCMYAAPRYDSNQF